MSLSASENSSENSSENIGNSGNAGNSGNDDDTYTSPATTRDNFVHELKNLQKDLNNKQRKLRNTDIKNFVKDLRTLRQKCSTDLKKLRETFRTNKIILQKDIIKLRHTINKKTKQKSYLGVKTLKYRRIGMRSKSEMRSTSAKYKNSRRNTHKYKLQKKKPHETIDFDNIHFKKNIECKNKNIKDIETQNDRYYDDQKYYINPGNYCYAISTMQLLRNIKDIINCISDVKTNKLQQDYENNIEAAKHKLTTEKNEENKKKIEAEIRYNKTSYTDLYIFQNKSNIFMEKLYPTKNRANKNFLDDILKLCFIDTDKEQDVYKKQQDSTEFFENLKIFSFLKELQFNLGYEYYDNKETKNFLKRQTDSSNILNIIPETLLTLEFESNKKEFNNIQEMLYYYQKAEVTDDKNLIRVTLNNSEVDASVKRPFLFVKKDNQYLVLSLKLFSFFSQTISKKENITITKLDDNICIRELNDNDLKENDPFIQFENGNSVTYELISVSCHIGRFGSGHYANFSKQQIVLSDNTSIVKWVYYNDGHNEELDSSGIFNDKTVKFKYVRNMSNNGVNYLDNNDDINNLNQDYYSPYFFLYKRVVEEEEAEAEEEEEAEEAEEE